MKKELRRIALIFAVLFVFMTTSLFLLSCGGEGSSTTTKNPLIPNISSTGTVSTESTSATSSGTANTDNTTSVPVDPGEGNYINPLTGLKTTYNSSSKRPVAIVVDNVGVALDHQSGLNQADVLYEALVAPGITRFLMVVSDYTDLQDVCNVRSARVYHIDLAANHNAVLVAHNGETWNDFVSVASQRLGGGWNAALGKNTFGYVNTKEEYAFGTKEGGQKYGTIKYYTGSYDSGRTDLQYDTIITSRALLATLQSQTSRFNLSGNTHIGSTTLSLKFIAVGTSKNMDGASSASNVRLNFTMNNYAGDKNVSYSYQDGKYYRYQDNVAHVDSVTNEQLSCTNLITLFTDVQNNKSGLSEDPNVTTMRTTGTGTGYYFHGGKCIKINWSKSTWDSALILTTEDGQELTLACGNTHIAYLNNTDISESVSFN